MSKILIIEDDTNINQMLNEALTKKGYEAISAYSGTEGLLRIQQESYQLVILDLILPGMNGADVLVNIRKYTSTPIIVLSAKDELDTKVDLLTLGANDYMTKPFSMVILGKRITALLRRSNPAEKVDVWTYGDLTVNFSGYSAHDSSGELEVTAKELDLLKLLVEHQGLVLSRSQILDGVWGDNSYVLDRLVDTYIKNLRKKLHLDCIKTVKGIGYKLEVSQ